MEKDIRYRFKQLKSGAKKEKRLENHPFLVIY
jgi:hypothetical protein